ncbi:MAG: amidohydrolase [Rhodospirillales bacterium]|nr:amidohydrolase [Rhodospirillales bacterium]
MTGETPGPDLIFHNAKVITLDQHLSIANAIAVKGERIIGVGDGRAMLDQSGTQARGVDLGGRAVVPGFIDGHAHMDREGLTQIYPSLAGADSIDEILQIIEGLVAGAEPGEWIVTMPLGGPPEFIGRPEGLADGRFPTRYDLDRVAPENPVYIRPIWGYWRHDMGDPLVSVANSMALRLAGITADTPNPCAIVEIDKDPGSGEPTGIFFEDSLAPVMELTFFRQMGGFTPDERVRGLESSLQAYLAYGTTGVFEGHGNAAEVIEAYKTLSARGELTMRAELPLSPSWESLGEVDAAALLGTWAGWLAGPGLGNDYLKVRGLFCQVEGAADDPEIIADGLRAQANPYTGWSSRYYDHALPREKLIQLMVEAARMDIRMATITTPMLDCIEEADRIEPIAGKRWVLGHISVLSDDQISRIRDMGLVTTTNTNRNLYRIASRLRDQLGPDRVNDITPLKRLREAGVPFSLATDNQPVSLFHPVWQAVARVDQVTGEVIAPDERISRPEALRAASLDGAYLCMSEKDRGTIEEGKLADFAVLTDDPLTVPEAEIKDIAAHLTVVGGKIVFEREVEA